MIDGSGTASRPVTRGGLTLALQRTADGPAGSAVHAVSAGELRPVGRSAGAVPTVTTASNNPDARFRADTTTPYAL
jgi:hypothetical protein